MKQSLTLLALALTVCLQGQSFFQDFEEGIEPMVLFDVDGHTPNASVAVYPDAWNRANPGFGNGTFVAVSNSWYQPVDTANDWMVTPLIQLPDSNVIIRWDAKAQDANFRDGYIVYVSTTGNTPADFSTVVFQTPAEAATWTTRIASLDAYAGQQVYIAFRNNSIDKFLLLMDNIFVGEQKQRDIKLSRVSGNINFGTTLEGNRNLSLTVNNFGVEALNSFHATWMMNGDTAVHAVTGVNIASGASYVFTHNMPVNYVVGDSNLLEVVLDSLNGSTDEQPADNGYSSGNFKVFPPVPNVVATSSEGEAIDLYEILASGHAVIFDFFASWCVPCEISTPILNNLYVANGSGEEGLDVIGITIHGPDNDAAVNALPWGSTYPLLSFSIPAYEMYVHFNNNHGLGQSAIPFFVMICPNPDDLAHSEIIQSLVGVPQDLTNIFNVTWQNEMNDCIESLPSAVEDIHSVEAFSLQPNPANDYLDIAFTLSEPTDMAMEVLDVTGKSLLRKSVQTFSAGENIERIDVSNFVGGTYFVRLTQQNAVNTMKFVVNN